MMESLPHSNTTHQWACLEDPRPIYVYSTNKEHNITRLSFTISNHGDIVGMCVPHRAKRERQWLAHNSTKLFFLCFFDRYTVCPQPCSQPVAQCTHTTASKITLPNTDPAHDECLWTI